jgi:stage V sporulation protein S
MKTQKEQHKSIDSSEIELRVAAGSQAQKVAGAIVKYMEEGYEVTLLAIGAGAVNQAVKGICIARGMVAAKGWNLYDIPGMVDEWIDNEKKTAIRFSVRK